MTRTVSGRWGQSVATRAAARSEDRTLLQAFDVQGRRRMSAVTLFAALLAVAAAQPSAGGQRATEHQQMTAVPSPASLTTQTRQETLDAYGRLPLSFEGNIGQADTRVKFRARGHGYAMFLAATEAVLSLQRHQAKDTIAVLRMQFAGTALHPDPTALDELPGKINYFVGNDPKKWSANVPHFRKVHYAELYPGIDLVYYGNQGQLEYDFIVSPGADPTAIALRFEGADTLELDAQGNLVLRIAGTELRQKKPRVYQEGNGSVQEIAGEYRLEGKNEVRFAVGAYDPLRPLIIDPVLVYSTYLGGTSIDSGAGIAVDAAGNAYVIGNTQSADFPTTAGAFDTTQNGSVDVFVTKLDPTGSSLIYSTYLGGSNLDNGTGIALDSAGNAYLTGFTFSTNFPTTAGAFSPAFNGAADAFVTKLDPTGARLVYSTYLGGRSSDEGHGIAVDSGGNAYVTGSTASTNFPTTPAAFDTSYNGGNTDAFVTKLNATGSAPLYSTYLGGTLTDSGIGIALDFAGDAYVTGSTGSRDFPTTIGAFDTTFNGGNTDAFITKLDLSGAALLYSTYLGGSNNETGRGIAVDGAGNAYVTDSTSSVDFPTTAGAYDTTYNGAVDAYVTKLDATGARLVYSTYVGGNGLDQGNAIALNAAGSAYVAGDTQSTNFPTTPDAYDTDLGDTRDAFVIALDATGSTLLHATYLGGDSTDSGLGIALDPRNTYVTGSTSSPDFPTSPGAFDTTFNGSGDGFVTKLGYAAVPATLVLTPAADSNPVGTSHTVTATVDDAGRQPVAGLIVRFSVRGSVTTSGSCTTDANGQCAFTYEGPTAPGSDAIRAFADTDGNNVEDPGEPSGAAAKTWIAGPPAAVVLRPAADANPVGTSHTVRASVADAFGNPLADVIVRFTITGSVTTSGQCTTDANGQCDFTYEGPTVPGSDVIRAFADTNGNSIEDPGEPSGEAAKTWIPAAPATVVLTPATDTNPVGTSHTVTATVRDAFGNPVAGAIVRFSVTGSVTASGQCTTDASGQCDYTYQGPTAPGSDAIHAFADTDGDSTQDPGEPSGEATKTWAAGPPATVVVAPAADANPVGTSHTVSATVRDAYGNPVSGVIVRFTVTGSTTASGSCTTDANGRCDYTYQGPTVPGSDAIHAFADTNGDSAQNPGEPSGDATKTWVAGAPASVVLTPAADVNPVGTSHTVRATVRDPFGNPVAGAIVRFSVTGSVTASGQCTTDANGQCDYTYQGPTVPGSDTIRAFADTDGDSTQDPGEPSGEATKTWAAGPPATVVVTPATDLNPVGTSHTVSATVRDAYGNPVSGAIVRFTVTGSTTASGSCTTDANGRCDYTYQGPTLPGSDAIHAFADTNGDSAQNPGEPSGDATKMWVAGAPATVVVTPPADSNPVGTSHTVRASVTDAYGNPVAGAIARFNVTGSVMTSGQCTTGANGQCDFTYQGPMVAGSDAIRAFADTDADTVQDPGEPAGGAAKTWVAGTPASITVTPPAADNAVGTQHCVVATVSDAFGNPLPGITVRFTVAGAINTSGTRTTDASGQATFCYMGPDIPGADAITAHADIDNDGAVDAGEPVNGATKSWLLPEATAGQVTGGGRAPDMLGTHEIAFGFNAKSGDTGVKGNCNVVDRAASVHVKCLDVTALVRSGTHATLFGNGTINGSPMVYRIDVDDLGEPGAGRDTFRIQTGSGYTAGGVLRGGNIQVR